MTTVLDKLEAIFRDGLGIEPPAPEVDLVESGMMDSLMLMTLLSEVEAAYSVTIPLEQLDLEELRSLSRLTLLVDRLSAAPGIVPPETTHELLVALRDGADGPPVFLIPNVTGAPLALRPLAQALQTTRPVYALAPLPPEQRPAPLRVEDLAGAYARAIRSVRGPGCVLAGVSFGGLVAYETARQLSRTGEPVERVILLDSRPAVRGLTRGAYWRFRALQPFRVLCYVLPDLPTRIPEVIRRAAPLLLAWARRTLSPAETRVAEASRWTTLAHLAGLAYRPGRYGGSVTLFVTRRPPLSTFSPEKAWSQLIDGALTVEEIPGGHLDFMRGSWLSALADRLSTVLHDK